MVKLEDLQVEEEVFDNPLISLHLKCMRLYGYIVSKNQRNKRFHLRKGEIVPVSFAIFSCLLFIKVSRGFENLADGATSCASAILYLSTSIATANAVFHRTRAVRMVSFLHEDMASLLRITDPLEENMMAQTVRYIRIISLLMWTSAGASAFVLYTDCLYRTMFLPATVFNIPEVLNGTAKPIMLFKLYPFGEVYDNFVVGYLGSWYAALLSIIVIPCWHTFVTCLMKYIVVKYQIINKRLEDYDIAKLSHTINKDIIDKMSEKEYMQWHFKMCEFYVNEQIKIRWFVNELQSLICIPVFSDFIMFSVLICFILYAMTSGTLSNMDYFIMALFLFVISFILWIYYWHATLVAECNDNLRFALYSSRWHEFPVPIQKSIRLMMMESTKPLIMKAIFVELNLKTFVNIVRGSYSYFSILRNANGE